MGFAPTTCRIYKIEPDQIAHMNTTSEVVTMISEAVTDFHNGYEMVLPPHSIRALLWSN